MAAVAKGLIAGGFAHAQADGAFLGDRKFHGRDVAALMGAVTEGLIL